MRACWPRARPKPCARFPDERVYTSWKSWRGALGGRPNSGRSAYSRQLVLISQGVVGIPKVFQGDCSLTGPTGWHSG